MSISFIMFEGTLTRDEKDNDSIVNSWSFFQNLIAHVDR